MLTAFAASAQTVNGRNFGIDGFAAYAGTPGTNHYLEGGTTGGAGGEVVKADNFAQLQAYLQSSKPYIVLVDHDITTGIKCYVESLSNGYLCADQSGEDGEESTYGERIMVASNKTLIGIADERGNAPLFSRITFVMQCTSNVIIRNCRFTMNGVPILKVGENKIVAWRDGQQVEVGDPDCIGIQADKTSAKTDWGAHVWIDHCEFFNGNADNKDRYDGLVDCKNNVQWLTISYNWFHDHDKACLWGKGDSDVYDNCRTISAHHNWFDNIQGSRLPLQRGGHVHYMNNYQSNCQDGWDLRTKSVGYADACYFKDSKAPILPDGGGVVNINSDPEYGVVYDNCQRVIVNHSGVTYVNAPSKYDKEFNGYGNNTWVPTETWSDYYVNNHDKAADVPAICKQYAGAGKISVWESYATTIPDADATKYAEACATQQTAACYDAEGNKVSSISGGGSGSGTETDPSGNAEVIFKMQISSSASELSIQNASDTKSIASYCSTLTGGTASVGLRNDASSAQKVIGSDSSQRHLRTPKNDVYVMITLDTPLAAGDKISYTGNASTSYEICFMADNTYSNAEATSNHLYTIPATSALVGKTVFYVSRAQPNNTFIQTLTITRPDNDDDATAIGTVETARPMAEGTLYDLTGRRVTTPKTGQLYIQNGRKYIYRNAQ